jgi:hypothetical protein
MLADPLREALCEHQEESAVIDTPLQKGARGFWCAGFDYYWSPEQDYAPLPGSLRFELFGISEELPWPRFRLDAGADFECWMLDGRARGMLGESSSGFWMQGLWDF